NGRFPHDPVPYFCPSCIVCFYGVYGDPLQPFSGPTRGCEYGGPQTIPAPELNHYPDCPDCVPVLDCCCGRVLHGVFYSQPFLKTDLPLTSPGISAQGFYDYYRELAEELDSPHELYITFLGNYGLETYNGTVIDYVAKPSDTCISPRLGNVLVIPDVIDDQHHLEQFGRVWYNRNSFPHIDDVEGPTGLIRSDLSSYRTNFNVFDCDYINNDGELNYICDR